MMVLTVNNNSDLLLRIANVTSKTQITAMPLPFGHGSVEIVRGSGNVFRDLGYPDADVRQAKALMGTQIMHVLDAEGLSTRQAEARTGVLHSEFSRIRQAKFSRFTIDRLMGILALLGQEVELSVSVRPRVDRTPGVAAPRPSV